MTGPRLCTPLFPTFPLTFASHLTLPTLDYNAKRCEHTFTPVYKTVGNYSGYIHNLITTQKQICSICRCWLHKQMRCCQHRSSTVVSGISLEACIINIWYLTIFILSFKKGSKLVSFKFWVQPLSAANPVALTTITH